jgi:hypothetical protein
VVTQTRPAFYALEPGGWRDFVTLLHPPYTLWHLSYVAIGAGLASEIHWGWLGATVAAFFLAMGIGAHALDELQGRPLRTQLSDRMLLALAVLSIAGAIAIGIVAAVRLDAWLLPFIVFGGFIVVAYNLELFGGAFHGDLWFPLAWGAFPLLTGYFAMTGQITWEALAAAAFAGLSSHAQRILSTPVRTIRRKVASVSGTIVYADGKTEPIGPKTLTWAPERGLQALAAATVFLGAALLLLHI